MSGGTPKPLRWWNTDSDVVTMCGLSLLKVVIRPPVPIVINQAPALFTLAILINIGKRENSIPIYPFRRGQNESLRNRTKTEMGFNLVAMKLHVKENKPSILSNRNVRQKMDNNWDGLYWQVMQR